jgi:flagellar biosynthesis/type III secretory pathway protein FliH
MAGFEPISLSAWHPRPAGRVTGGLLVPDFNASPAPTLPTPDPLAAAEAAEAAQAELWRSAHAAGLAEGMALARQEAAEAHATEKAASLARIAEALPPLLASAGEASQAAAMAAAEALAGCLLAALDAALPAAAARLAPETAAALARAVLPILDYAPRVVLAVAPGHAAASAALIGDARIEVVEDPALPPGDARANWRNGRAEASLAQRRQAVAALLTNFGLTETQANG